MFPDGSTSTAETVYTPSFNSEKVTDEVLELTEKLGLSVVEVVVLVRVNWTLKLAAQPVTVNVGVLSLVILSVLLVPVSEASSKSIVGAAGAV